MEDYKMARAYRDCRVGTIGGGSSEIMREIIAKMVIDDTSYQRAGSVSSAPAANKSAEKKVETKSENQTQSNTNTQKQPVMSFEAVSSAIKEKAAIAKPLGNTLKFNFGDNNILLDGKGDSNAVTENDAAEADCTVDVSLEDLQSMLSGDLNPMNAFMAGKIKVKGDMSVAMKLGSLMG